MARVLAIAVTLCGLGAAAQGSSLTELQQLGELASSRAEAPKVRQLGARVADDFRALPPTPLTAEEERTLERLEALDRDDFDDAFLDLLQSRCEALRPELEKLHGADAHLALDLVTQYANDARRVRGEYVPLADDPQ